MKTFDEIYEELQNVDTTELNSAWKAAKKKDEKANKIARIICLIVDILAIIIFFENSEKYDWILSLIPIIMIALGIVIINLFIVAIISVFYSGKEKNIYNEKYKKIVIKKLMKNFYDNLEYFPNKEMPEYIYEKLQYEFYDIYESEDYMEAEINNKYSIQMAEVLTQKEEEYEDSEGESHTREITLFHGLFAKIVMHKSIKGELKIMQNGTFLLDKRLKMDSSEFEKYFDVKASNQIMGMQILTADVMEELVDFENKTKMKFDIYIKENELYLRFHSEDMFEPTNFKRGPLDRNLIRKYFYMLNFTYNLSNELIKLIDNIEI